MITLELNKEKKTHISIIIYNFHPRLYLPWQIHRKLLVSLGLCPLRSLGCETGLYMEYPVGAVALESIERSGLGCDPGRRWSRASLVIEDSYAIVALGVSALVVRVIFDVRGRQTKASGDRPSFLVLFLLPHA